MATLDEAIEHYRTTLKREPPNVDGLPEEKKAEAVALLKQAADLNQPFVTDEDFRRAMGLTGSQ